MLDCHIIKLDAGNITRHDLTAFVDGLPNHTRDISHSSECRLHFLHLIRLNCEIVLR